LVTGYRFIDAGGAFVGTGYFKLDVRRVLVAACCARGDDRCVEADGCCREADRGDGDNHYPDDRVGWRASVRSRRAVMCAR
jgi:hypothetical protein